MPTEQELKNELFALREKLAKKEEEIREIKSRIAKIEQELGMGQPTLAAPIPDVSVTSNPSPTLPPAPTPTITPAPTPARPSIRPQAAIQQKIPRSGTSQLHARETQFECPNCGSHYNSEVEDKSRILYVVGAGTRIYAKKHRCMNCGNEWSD